MLDFMFLKVPLHLLFLLLLHRYCSFSVLSALHDPTPRTFTVHVLELFERGIFDRQSIHFLYDLNLVPSVSSAARLALTEPGEEQALATATSETTVNILSKSNARFPHRSAEVNAIRTILEQVEYQRLVDKSALTANNNSHQQQKHTVLHHQTSFAADQYPLSLSRYQREFYQKCLLSSGSFGQVFCATHKMDGRDYAVKRVAFQASGFSNDSVQQGNILK
jgi:hypothetical protein